MVALAFAVEIVSKIDWELVQLVLMEDYDNSAQEVSRRMVGDDGSCVKIISNN